MIYQENCEVLENKQIAPNYFKILFKSKNIHKKAKPGQFVHILIRDTKSKHNPFLRRPFSINDITEYGFSIIYRVVGLGTKILSKIYSTNKRRKVKLDILGPLGNGYEIVKDKTAVLIAGGCGAAPLLFLEKELKKKKIPSHFFLGATTKDLLICREDFTKTGTKLYISTDDGSCGEKCSVSALYSSYLNSFNPKKTIIYACGPKAMLKAVSEIAAKNKIPCQVSLEEYMACGIGACLGCVVSTKKGNKRVCKDGPVFDSRQIIWE